MKLNKIALATFGLVILCSCAQLPKTVSGLDPSSAGANQAILFLETHFQTDQTNPADTHCNLRINHQGSVETFLVRVLPGDQTLYLPVAPGKYENESFECPGNAWDNQKPLMKNAQAVAGKISYAGKFKFKIAGGHLALGSEQRKDLLASLHTAIQKLPASTRAKLVSAYTLRPITLEMSEPRTPPGFNLRVKKNPGETIETGLLYSTILACEAAASTEDLTLVGHFSYLGLYKDGELKKFEIAENQNAFAPAYGKCVETAFRKFTPANQSTFAVQISF